MSIDTTPHGPEPLFPAPEPPTTRVCDPDTGWDRVSVIEALTVAARREREAKADQLILIARAAEVWSWIDNIDDVVAQIRVADHLADPDARDRVKTAAETGDTTLLDELLAPAGKSDSDTAPGVLHGERLYHYGADGTPACSEFLRLEIGPALGIAPETAARLIGDVLDLRHRLPGMWAHVETGRVLGWVGCQVARKTRTAGLPQHLCQELDRRISPYAPGWTPNKILTQTDKLIVTLDPDTAEARRRDELGRRYVSFWADRHPTGAGMMNVRAQLDAVPAADLDATLDALAEILEAVRPDLDHDSRRARSLELLADPAHAARVLAGDLTDLDDAGPGPDAGAGADADDPAADTSSPASVGHTPGTLGASDRSPACATGPSGAIEAFVKPGTPAAAECGCAAPGRVPTGREISLIVHVNPADLILGAGGDTPRLGPIVRTLLDQLMTEAAHTGRLTVKPVLDPMAVAVSASDTPPDSMVERLRYRNPTVVFPYSDRASTGRYIDLDHTIPRPQGPTTEPNLGPLDRLTHRWKTHTTCRLVQVRPGTFTWHTPAGQTFTVTPHGTYPDDPGPDWPTPPPPRSPEQQAADLLASAQEALIRAQHHPAHNRPARTTGTAGAAEAAPTGRATEEPPPF